VERSLYFVFALALAFALAVAFAFAFALAVAVAFARSFSPHAGIVISTGDAHALVSIGAEKPASLPTPPPSQEPPLLLLLLVLRRHSERSENPPHFAFAVALATGVTGVFWRFAARTSNGNGKDKGNRWVVAPFGLHSGLR